MRGIFIKVIVCLCVFGICAQKSQATIIVSGDVFITYALNPISANYYNPDNQHFFLNVLDGATNIAIVKQPPTLTNAGNEFYTGKLNNFYSTVPSMNISMISTITSSSLLNVGMLFAPMPTYGFSSDEIAAVNDYIDSGGSVFFLGESNIYPDRNAIINQTLADIGSSMRISNNALDKGKKIAVGNQIANDDYTIGVPSLTYGAVSGVTGGTPLFYTTGGVPFIAYEDVSRVPEPTLPASLTVGLLFFFGFIKRYGKK
jgi:hypothetical protein